MDREAKYWGLFVRFVNIMKEADEKFLREPLNAESLRF
jgi:hypothetical protein